MITGKKSQCLCTIFCPTEYFPLSKNEDLRVRGIKKKSLLDKQIPKKKIYYIPRAKWRKIVTIIVLPYDSSSVAESTS